MQKIIAVIDEFHADVVIQYSIHLAQKKGALLVGAFVDSFMDDAIEQVQTTMAMAGTDATIHHDVSSFQEVNCHAQETFIESCTAKEIAYSLFNHHLTIDELLHESVYADLMILGRQLPPSKNTSTANSNVSWLLSNVQCPVVITPNEYSPVESVIFLYDGSAVSVSAMRIFDCLFPATKSLAVNIVTISGYSSTEHPSPASLKAFAQMRFPAARFEELTGDPAHTVIDLLKRKSPGTLVVAGSYQRNAASHWYKASLADLLVEEINLPILINQG